MEAIIYLFSKKRNSTAQPLVLGGSYPTSYMAYYEVDVHLKDNTSVYNPTFTISKKPTWTTSSSIEDDYVQVANYMYVKEFGLYYYVNDVVKVTASKIWELPCTVDLLASFKRNILKTQFFMRYCSWNRNYFIPDTRLSYTKPNISAINTAHLKSYNISDSIVVSYISANDSGNGSVAYASLNATQLQKLNAYLMSNDFQDSLDKQLDSTASAIVGCMLFPFTITGDTATSSLNIAGKSSGVSGSIIKYNQIDKGTITLDYPSYEANFNNDFRDLSPYRSYILFLPAYGYVDIPAEYILIKKGGNLEVDYVIDKYTGSITYQIDGLGKFDGSIAVNIPTAYSGINAINTISGGASTVGSVLGNLATGNIGGAIGSAISGGFNTYISANQKNIGTIGSASGSLASILAQPIDIGAGYLDLALYVTSLTGPTPHSVNDLMGRPLNDLQYPYESKNGTQYFESTNASVKANLPSSLLEELNSLIDNGIYIE